MNTFAVLELSANSGWREVIGPVAVGCFSLILLPLLPFLIHLLSFHSATTMKFDQVNTLVCASLWPIIDCLLAPSPRVKQKSRSLRNLQKSQVSRSIFNFIIMLIYSAASLMLFFFFFPYVRAEYMMLSYKNDVIHEFPVCVQMMTSLLHWSSLCCYDSLPLRSDWTLISVKKTPKKQTG